MTAAATRARTSATTPAQNREQLVRDVAQWSRQPITVDDYPTWRTVFRLLLDLRAPNPLVIVLDEFQYLGDDPKDLAAVASELNAAWDIIEPWVRAEIEERALTPSAASTPIIPEQTVANPRLRGAIALVAAPTFAAPMVG